MNGHCTTTFNSAAIHRLKQKVHSIAISNPQQTPLRSPEKKLQKVSKMWGIINLNFIRGSGKGLKPPFVRVDGVTVDCSSSSHGAWSSWHCIATLLPLIALHCHSACTALSTALPPCLYYHPAAMQCGSILN